MAPSDLQIKVLESDDDLQAAFDLRFEVFVDEQNVPRDIELDEYDLLATHHGAFVADDLVAVARTVDMGEGIAKIGRVAVRARARGTGVGRALMLAVLEGARAGGHRMALLDSQCRVEEFYRRLGFVSEGEVFLDAGIDHIRMRRPL